MHTYYYIYYSTTTTKKTPTTIKTILLVYPTVVSRGALTPQIHSELMRLCNIIATLLKHYCTTLEQLQLLQIVNPLLQSSNIVNPFCNHPKFKRGFEIEFDISGLSFGIVL